MTLSISRRSADMLLAGVIFIAFIAASVTAIYLPWQAATLPLLLSGLGSVLSMALIISLKRQPYSEARAVLKRGDAVSFLWFVCAVLAITLLGFKFGGFLFAFLYFRWSAGFGWISTLLLALPVPLITGMALEVLLGRIGFDGLLLGASF